MIHRPETLKSPALLCLVLAAALLVMAPPAPAEDLDRCDLLTVGSLDFLRYEIRANTFTSSTQGAVTIAFDEDGSFVAAWDSRRQEDGSYGVFAQRFSPAGLRVGEEVNANIYRRSTQWKPAAAFDAGGRCWIGWDSFGQDGNGFGCFLRRFDTDLGAGAAEIGLTRETAGNQSGLVIVPSDGGGLIAAWIGCEGEQARSKAMFCVLDGEGAPVTGPAPIDVCGDRTENLVTLAPLADGGFVAVWSAMDADGLPGGIHARLFGPGGDPRAPAFKINVKNDIGSIEPAVAACSDDGFVVTWMQSDPGCGDYNVVACLYGAEGLPVAPAFTVQDAAGDDLSGATVAAAGDGRFCIAWNSCGDTPDRKDIMARIFSADGDETGPVFRVNQRGKGNQTLLAAQGKKTVAFGPGGRLAFAWTGSSGLGDRKAANVTLLLPADSLSAFDATWSRLANAAGRLAGLGESERKPALVAEDAKVSGITMIADTAGPHEPPVRDPSMRSDRPYGGDADPFSSRVDPGFLGVTNTGWTPPDPHLAAGPNHIAVMTNGAIAWFTKSGTLQFQDEIEDSYGFWGGVGATGFVFDPEVIYDPQSDRFMAMANERSGGGSHFLLAVSDDSDPNGTWYKYRIDVTSEGGGSDIDSPNICVNDSVVCLTADFFGPQKYLVYFIEKSDLLVGNPGLNTNYLRITGSQSYGIPVIYGSAPGFYMIEHYESSSNNSVRLHAITDPLGSLNHQTYNLTVPSYSPPADPNQMGSSLRMETFDNRFWSCVYRNGSLWAAHHQGSSTVKARWYEIDMANWPVSGTPSLVQSGDIDAGSGVHTYFNSISVDASNNALMCFAHSSSSHYISVARAYRAAGDPLGTMQPLEITKASSGPYTYYGRWGDYSAVSVDPAGTFWYHHEYAPSSSSWNTWIASLTVGQPPVPDIKVNGSDNPGSLPYPASLDVTISLDPGDWNGDPADWWVTVTKDTSNTWWRSYKQGWKKYEIRFAGATLRPVNSYSVYAGTPPIGSYVWTFGVDEKNNINEGTFTDSVNVQIY